jgi:hypothetical protein
MRVQKVRPADTFKLEECAHTANVAERTKCTNGVRKNPKHPRISRAQLGFSRKKTPALLSRCIHFPSRSKPNANAHKHTLSTMIRFFRLALLALMVAGASSAGSTTSEADLVDQVCCVCVCNLTSTRITEQSTKI